jgi:hypothetical protein
MGWEPADNKEHKIINCPVPGCPMGKKPAVFKATGSVSLNKLIKDTGTK